MSIAKYLIPAGCFPARLNKRESKVVEAAQNGIADECCLRQAIEAAPANALIQLAPGTITLTEKLVLTKPVRLQGASLPGDSGTKIVGDFDDALLSIQLEAQASDAEVQISNIYFNQMSDDTDVIEIDNDTVGQKLKVRFDFCIIELLDAASTGKGIASSHSDATKEIQLYISGRGWEKVDAIDFVTKSGNDTVRLYRMRMNAAAATAALVTSNDDVGAQFQILYCEVPHEKATAGGHASQNMRVAYGYSVASQVFAVIDTNDLVGSHSENIVS